MVLSLKRWKSRSSPGIAAGAHEGKKRGKNPFTCQKAAAAAFLHIRAAAPEHLGAGWSSPVARQAHNLKVVGSNPTPATNSTTTKAPAKPAGAFGVRYHADSEQRTREEQPSAPPKLLEAPEPPSASRRIARHHAQGCLRLYNLDLLPRLSAIIS